MIFEKMTKLQPGISEHLEKISEAASFLWERGWAERNAGNISLDLCDFADTFPADAQALKNFESLPIAGLPKEAAGTVFYVTGTGERLRELKNPEKVGAIIKFNETATAYYVLWGGTKGGFRPTSEFISHLLIHLGRSGRNSTHRVVVHTHPIELIALSHHPDLYANSEAFTNAIWSMLPEVRAFVPKGVAVLSYILPGSEELGRASLASIVKNDVVLWAKHGALATGTDALNAFDFLDVANKGALIYLKCLAAGFKPLGMSLQEMDELAKAFNL